MLRLSRNMEMTDIITNITTAHDADGSEFTMKLYLFDDSIPGTASLSVSGNAQIAGDRDGTLMYDQVLEINLLQPNVPYMFYLRSIFPSGTQPILTIGAVNYPITQEIGLRAVTEEEIYDPPAPPLNRSTLVIEHIMTGERFMFPKYNINMETEEGFVQTQYVPREFKVSDDQTPVEQPYFEKTGYPAQPKDPIDIYNYRDKLW